jgi:hypothetical protein
MYITFQLKNLGVDGRIILKCVLKKLGMKCGMESSGSERRVLVNTVMNLRVP